MTSRILTDKQERFVQEYLIDWNATQAAIRAGYSQKNADKIGPELLGKTGVMLALQERKRELAETTKLQAQDVINDTIRLKDMCMAVDENGKAKDAPTAARCLEMLGRYTGTWEQGKRDDDQGVSITIQRTQPRIFEIPPTPHSAEGNKN